MSLFSLKHKIFARNGDIMKDKKNGYIYYEYHEKNDREEISETAWKSVFHWLYAIVGVFFVFVIVWTLFFNVVSVEGDSMKPTLRSGDKVLMSTFNYIPEQGDIIAVSMPGEESMLIKRVIATENQTVDIDYRNGSVTVDGVILDEKYVTELGSKIPNEIAYPYTVPSGCVFVLGDNRAESNDSRNVYIGSIDENRIVGKAVLRLYPFSDRDIYD